jgi:hypothetical protein
MKTALLATLIAGLFVGGAAATLVAVGAGHTDVAAALASGGHRHHGAGADEGALHGGMAGDMMGDHDAQTGMARPHFPPASGTVPSSSDAQKLEEIPSVRIVGDKGFNPKNGVRDGSGTLSDPYVISGYYVTGDLYLGDTDACFLVTGNYISGQLSLNWNGQCVWVHHNFIGDLRVNENVKRTGDDTGGLIEDNQIAYVGQIRHYDGEVRNNVIGPRGDRTPFNDPENALPFTKDTRVLNIDGFNEGWFHHNTIYGSTDLKLHGHHHSTGFLATHSHYHGDDEAKMAAMQHDHTNRWESVVFEDNKIVDPDGYGLRYTDEAHAGDDRTAASETTKQLSEDHQHHTDVVISGNDLSGSGIWVDILNADDSLHTMFNPAWMTISGNAIHLQQRESDGLMGTQFFGNNYEANTGIKLWSAKEAWITIAGNSVDYTASSSPSSDPAAPVTGLAKQVAPFLFPDETPVAISLDGVRSAHLSITGNKATGVQYGIRADQMDNMTTWFVQGNDFGLTARGEHGVWYDDSVEQKPVTLGSAPSFPDPHLDMGDQPYDKLPSTQDGGHHH